MKFSAALIALVSAGIATAAPTVELARSQKALIDSASLVCSQYPGSDYVMIGPLKVPCDSPLVEVEKRHLDEMVDPADLTKKSVAPSDVDLNWETEYARKRAVAPSDVDLNWETEYARKRAVASSDVDLNWETEYARKRAVAPSDLDLNWEHEYARKRSVAASDLDLNWEHEYA